MIKDMEKGIPLQNNPDGTRVGNLDGVDFFISDLPRNKRNLTLNRHVPGNIANIRQTTLQSKES
ncbi:MAG: hypothetical protein LKI94_12275 [Sporolactobacillus sp.]|jgi:hypothetical protein|nr:hypothetical protein [Sporolactobacillus sp.]